MIDKSISKPLKKFSSNYEAKKFIEENKSSEMNILEEQLETPFIKCSGRNSCPEIVQGKFAHFVSRKAMDIEGLGEEILLTLINISSPRPSISIDKREYTQESFIKNKLICYF